MINSDQLFSKYETLLQRTILDFLIISNRTSTNPTKLSNVFVKDTSPSITIICDCSNEGNASNIVIGIVQFLPSLYVILVEYLGSINGTHHSETINNVLFIIIQTKQCYNNYLFEFEFFRIRKKKMTENVHKMCFVVNFKIPLRHPHFLWAQSYCSYPKPWV